MHELAQKLSGRFIVIDGPDGSGKSTQLELLAGWLIELGANVIKTRDPGGTPIGESVRKILLDKSFSEMTVGCEIMLYMASRTQLAGEVIAPALREGRCVLCDRWISSTVAYQVAGGAEEDDVLRAYEVALHGFGADLTVILDIPAEVGLRRAGKIGGHDRMESKGIEFHRRVRDIFLNQATEKPDSFAVVDAGGDIEQVQNRLREVISQWAKGYRPGPEG